MAVKASVNNQNQTTVRVGQQNAIRVGSTSVSGKDTATTAVNVVGGRADVTELAVSGLSTFTGIVTTASDLYVGGDLYLTDDLVLDNISGNSLDISGISSVGFLTATDVHVSGAVTATEFYGDGANLTNVAISGADATFNNLNVTGITTTSTLVGTALSISGIGTVTDTLKVGTGITASAGVITATTFDGNAITATSASGLTGNPNIIVSNIVGTALSISGIGTVTDTLKVGTGITASAGVITATTFDGNAITATSASGLTGNPNIIVSNIVGTALSISGIASASAFADFDYLQAPYGGTTTFAVTVASKSNHRYQGQGSGSAYYINGIESPVLTLTPGRTYRFTNNNTGTHPLKFYYEADKTTPYTTGVSFQNTYTEITVSDTTPNVLHYQCDNHGLMGNAVITNSNVVDTPYTLKVGTGITASAGVITATTFDGNAGTASGLSNSPDINVSNIVGTALSISGITTMGNVVVGGATTDLVVIGDARVTGILTIGTASITLDGENGEVIIPTTMKVGSAITCSNSGDSFWAGIVTATTFSGSGADLTDLSIPGISTTGTSNFNNLTVSGNVTIGGTLTYDDVTNIDSVGLVTAQSGVVVVGGGVSIAAGGLSVSAGITTVGFATATDVWVSGAVTATSFYGDGTNLTGVARTDNINADSLYVSGITTVGFATATDVWVSGAVTATSFYGDGTNLTGVARTDNINADSLYVSGITTVGFATATDVWVSGAVTATSFYGTINSANILRYSSGFTASAGVAVGIDTFPKDSYDSAEYVLYFKLGTDIQSQKLLVMDNGTVAYSNEYALMYHEKQLVDLSCTVSGSNIIVSATPVAGISGALTYVWQRSILSL